MIHEKNMKKKNVLLKSKPDIMKITVMFKRFNVIFTCKYTTLFLGMLNICCVVLCLVSEIFVINSLNGNIISYTFNYTSQTSLFSMLWLKTLKTMHKDVLA